MFLRVSGGSEHFLQARGHCRQRIGIQPFAPDPEAGKGLRADDGLAGGKLHKFVLLPMIEPMRPGVGVEDPVFLDAVLLAD